MGITPNKKEEMTTYCQRIFPWIEKDAYRVESERGRGGRSDMTVSQSTLGVTNRVFVICGIDNHPEQICKGVVRNQLGSNRQIDPSPPCPIVSHLPLDLLSPSSKCGERVERGSRGVTFAIVR